MSIGLLIETGKSLTKFQSDIISVDLDVTLDESHEWLNDVVTRTNQKRHASQGRRSWMVNL